jgi:hypothetical protein
MPLRTAVSHHLLARKKSAGPPSTSRRVSCPKPNDSRGGRQHRALSPRRRHQDLESHAARAPAPAPGIPAAARRLPRPPTDPNYRRIGTATVRCMARSFERERPYPYQGSAPACFLRIAPATCANDLPVETAGDRCEPLGSVGVWTKRGPSACPAPGGSGAPPGGPWLARQTPAGCPR